VADLLDGDDDLADRRPDAAGPVRASRRTEGDPPMIEVRKIVVTVEEVRHEP
jgi:hypothetical protein